MRPKRLDRSFGNDVMGFCHLEGRRLAALLYVGLRDDFTVLPAGTAP